MRLPLTQLEKAGRLFRLLGWFHLVIALLVIISIAFSGIPRDLLSLAAAIIGGSVLWGVIAAVAIFQLKLGTAIIQNKKWARAAGIICAGLQLLEFPIGTFAGGYILWYMIDGWKDSPIVETRPAS